jgi:predicted nucleic acid-binding protein
MTSVLLDTSFLITFSNPNRKNHPAAKQYLDYCVAQKIRMYLPALVAGEFAVRQSVEDLPLERFLILPYNLPHALKAAEFSSALKNRSSKPEDLRSVIINDINILGQAESEKIPVILSEDESTLSRYSERLRKEKDVKTTVLLLKDGFIPGRLTNPNQPELPLG